MILLFEVKDVILMGVRVVCNVLRNSLVIV